MIIDNIWIADRRHGQVMARSGRRRVGIIGAGWVIGQHLEAWRRQSGRAEVVAVADPSAEAREARCAGFAIRRGYADARATLDAEDLDAVDICAPRELHADRVRLAAAKRLPVICQKPLRPAATRRSRSSPASTPRRR
jgi:predicted dehydrogenase